MQVGRLTHAKKDECRQLLKKVMLEKKGILCTKRLSSRQIQYKQAKTSEEKQDRKH